jgi:flagellar hook-associated protein FlgK
VSQVSLETEFADVMVSKLAYKASAAIMRTEREFNDTLLDIVA